LVVPHDTAQTVKHAGKWPQSIGFKYKPKLTLWVHDATPRKIIGSLGEWAKSAEDRWIKARGVIIAGTLGFGYRIGISRTTSLVRYSPQHVMLLRQRQDFRICER
jgi:hypothetical protein